MITLNNDHINNYSTKRSYIFEMYDLLVDTSHAGYVTSLESCQLKLKYLWKHKSKPNKGVYISDPCEICI